ncbi:Hemocyte protein-glutamine gamma-glutamyltransferase [Amphibalanus amphitrite]|uniref:Hemocyte protein-glutamine gamma-glutamyltransferase n=1 Tax=Amphibalanus amphitrite TaxID=1232801 RepID=A0A6A4WUR9_AMPAM|nr:Hemocyte protein-glutamine gamma-glutamyltransferase [Amphibalanus amphitrite]
MESHRFSCPPSAVTQGHVGPVHLPKKLALLLRGVLLIYSTAALSASVTAEPTPNPCRSSPANGPSPPSLPAAAADCVSRYLTAFPDQSPGAFQTRSSRPNRRDQRRPTSPALPPFPGDSEERLSCRYPSPAAGDYRQHGDYDRCPQRGCDRYPQRDYSPRPGPSRSVDDGNSCDYNRSGDWRSKNVYNSGDCCRSGDYSRPGDYYRSGNHRRSKNLYNSGDCWRSGDYSRPGDYYRRDYEDYLSPDDTEPGRVSDRNYRAPSTDQERRRRAATAADRSSKREAALSPSRPSRRGDDRRSLCTVPYFGYSTLGGAPRQEPTDTRVGDFSSGPNHSPDTMHRRYNRRMGGSYAGYASEMASRFRRDNDRRQQPSEAVSELPHVKRVEFYAPQNARVHHTLKYELVGDRYRADPVLRRGQPFYLAVQLDRQINPASEKLYVVFTYGPRAAVTLGTKVYLVANKREFTKEKQHWDVRIHGVEGDTLVLQSEIPYYCLCCSGRQIQIPYDCLVGDWSASIQTVADGSHGRRRAEFRCRENVYILFNPWCEEDPCYMENEAERDEYVTNDNGKIFVGAHNRYKGRHWVFGQHDNAVLPAVQLILEMSGLSHAERGSPVKVVRAITGALHSENEGGGVLEARWNGQYEGGVSPWTWTGSVRILEQFLRSGGATVKYGQCWVFAGLLTTVCRALGIPCRPVTNFVSAHDTDGTLTVDKFFDLFGTEIEHGPNGDANDSLWNFHVWNDCGPCSLEAIRRGEVGFGFDTTFLFSEVNADLVHWREDPDSDWGFSKMKRDHYHVGRSVLTKRSGPTHDDDDQDIENITHLYKNPEGTAAERLAVFNAVRGTAGAQKYFDYPESGQEDVTFELTDIDQVMIGQPFHVDVSIVNNAEEERTIKVSLHANSMYYTGIKAMDIVTDPVQEFVLQPGHTEKMVVEITPEQYMDKLVDYCMVKIYAMASVTETRQAWSEEDDFVISKPKLSIQLDGPCVVGQQCLVNFSFVNPLSVPLTDCMFSFEGSGLIRPSVSKLRSGSSESKLESQWALLKLDKGQQIIICSLYRPPRHSEAALLADFTDLEAQLQRVLIDYPRVPTVQPGATFTHAESFVPRVSGEKTIVASFQCRQLFDIEGSKTLTVSG